MSEITASMVKELREATGLGMMECKKALVEAKGDFKVAEEQLRIKSGAKASKAASRVTAEGVVSAFIAPDGKTGAVTEVNDLLGETRLHIAGEVKIPIHHCLMVLPGTDHRTLRAVYSHPQALGQCRDFIARSRLEARPFYDTAGAAKMLRQERPPATAVIASRLCADLYDLEIVQEDIEDHASNATRFVALSGEPIPVGQEEGNKCSIIFSLAHRAGELFAMLKIFSDRDINITRIESRPLRRDPGSYAFFLDFEGSDRDRQVIEALDAAKERSKTFKFLGCYPKSREP